MAQVKGLAEARREADAKAERERKSGTRELVLTRPPLPSKYHYEVLRRAYEYHRVTENYPFNPRCLIPRSVWDIDMEFVTEYERYREWVQFWIDFPDRPEGIRE